MSPLTTLSFSIYSNPGAYVLLLGSGISRTANIPTGWEIECDLIRKIALANGNKTEGDEHEWYKKEFGKDASYSGLLEELVKEPTERVQLMRPYFEPNEQDRELKYKQPTKAHHAIAQLLSDGFIKVVITTNFDRLLEQSLEEIGLTPQVISQESDWEKATPIVHSKRPTIIKVNGDYIDCKFRNTEGELDHYPDYTREQLTWIFENYGLITCGWSGEWDKGLIDILKSSRQSRYGTYLTYMEKGKPTEKQIELSISRNGTLLSIKDADNFFEEMNEQVHAIAEASMPDDLDDKIVVARIKKYLSSDEYRIKFADLLQQLSDNAVKKVLDNAHYNFPLTKDNFEKYVKIHTEAIHQFLLVSPEVIRWGNEEQVLSLGEIVERLCLRPFIAGEVTTEGTQYLHAIAPTLLLNAVGVCCVKYKRFRELNKILSLVVPDFNFFNVRAEKLLFLIGDSHLGPDKINALLNQRLYYPYSLFIRETIESYLLHCFINANDYVFYFNMWEHLKSLVYQFNHCGLLRETYFPMGQFIRDRISYERQPLDNLYTTFFKSADDLKQNWEPIRQGMFGGDYNGYKKLYDQAEDYYNEFWR